MLLVKVETDRRISIGSARADLDFINCFSEACVIGKKMAREVEMDSMNVRDHVQSFVGRTGNWRGLRVD